MQTFLFTDIEGSTRLWNRAPLAMAAAVQRQEAVLRQVIERRGGLVFKTVGDGLYAVFSHAPDALVAAVDAQRFLLAEEWSGFDDGDTIRVRIAVHTGSADARGGDFFGPTLNRLSRTLAAGHGGQILCTGDTLDACAENWPDGIEPRDLGERTLRDVSGSGRIFQLIAEGLPEHFLPLITLDPRVHNLPRWPTAMAGRQSEQARLRTVLRAGEHRLISVLGAGGVGKTRLTTEVAAQLLDEFQDGIRFVDLSALRDDAQVVPAMVLVTGAADQLLDPRDALLDWLRPRMLLLVLDNCEQVIGGVAAICSEILNIAPGIVLLATSRVPIRIRGERQLRLEPLPLPGAVGTLEDPAIRLFVERARDVNDRFAFDRDNERDIASICRFLDGLPLAIELAAAWVRMLTPDALYRRLQESRGMLRDGARDLPDRQQTLASTIAWSYDLLEPEDQRAFRRLAVFRGGIAVDAAAAVIWDQETRDPLWALSRLDALVQANLLQVAPDRSGEPRFVLLQTIQEFAIGILQSTGEWEDASAAHAYHFATVAAAADEHYSTNDVSLWLDRLDREFENLRTSIDFFVSSPSSRQAGLEMAVALWEFLDQRGHETEARTWLTRLFDDSPAFDASLRARALLLLGNSWMNNLEQAETFYQHAAATAREAGDDQLQRSIEGALGLVSLVRGDFDRAVEIGLSLVEAERRAGGRERLGYALIQLAQSYCGASQFDKAVATADDVDRLEFDPTTIAWLELIRGRALRRARVVDAALDALRRAQSSFERMDAKLNVARCHLEMAAILASRDTILARESVMIANEALAENADPYTVADALEVNALVLAAEGRSETAAILLGATRAWRSSTGTILSTHDQNEHDVLADSLQDAIGADRFVAAVSSGSEMSLRTAVELARASLFTMATSST